MERVLLGTPKSEATSFWGLPFSSSLRALNLKEFKTLKIYLNAGALLQKWSLCLMSDMDFCRMEIKKFNAMWKFHLVFDVRFNISSGLNPTHAIFPR